VPPRSVIHAVCDSPTRGKSAKASTGAPVATATSAHSSVTFREGCEGDVPLDELKTFSSICLDAYRLRRALKPRSVKRC